MASVATDPTQRLSYTPALDGIRAVAVLLVLGYHARVPITPGGFIGVDLFFVLSGFLITRILHAEAMGTGTIAVGRFYLRRARRLYPALLLMLAVYLCFAGTFWPGINHARDALLAALYLTNYSILVLAAPVILTHTWSLAVEEQFYLLWPWLLRTLRGARLVQVLIVAYIAITLWRIGWTLQTGQYVSPYVRFDTRASGLIAGALIALVPVQLSRPRLMLLLAALLLAALNAVSRWASLDFLIHGITIAEFGAALMIIAALQAPGLLAHPALAFIGKLSYGMYLWHYPLMRIVRDDWHWATTFFVCTAASLLLAWLSFVTIERWLRAPASTGR